jgi:LysM repeat protein
MATIKDEHDADFVMSESHGKVSADAAEEPYYDLGGYRRRKKLLSPIVVAVIAVVAVIVLLVLFVPRSKESPPDKQLTALESRLASLEARVAQLEGLDQQVAAQEKTLTQMAGGLERVRSDVNGRLDQMHKELASLEQRQSQPAPKPAEAAKPSESRKPEAAAQAEPKRKVYEVAPGDTLFGISRHHGLTVEQLRTYNKLGPNAVIQPGQKLFVSPP